MPLVAWKTFHFVTGQFLCAVPIYNLDELCVEAESAPNPAAVFADALPGNCAHLLAFSVGKKSSPASLGAGASLGAACTFPPSLGETQVEIQGGKMVGLPADTPTRGPVGEGMKNWRL